MLAVWDKDISRRNIIKTGSRTHKPPVRRTPGDLLPGQNGRSMNLTTGPELMLKLRKLGPIIAIVVRLYGVVLNEAQEQVYWAYR
jgi:hypothetical protein